MEDDKSLAMERVQLQKLPGILLSGEEQCPKDLLDAEPHPSDHTLVMFADLVYTPKESSTFIRWNSFLESDADYGIRILSGKQQLQGWQILITANNTDTCNGYFGAAFVHTGLQQVVVAHRGTDPTRFGPLFTDVQGILRTKFTACMTSAMTFMDHIRQAINSANNQQRHYTLAITGHSLGAWLAQITTFSVKYLAVSQNRFEEKPEDGIHAKTVGFDSPGARDMLDQILHNYYDWYTMNVYLDRLNITLYLSAPNHINTCGEHLGRIYRVFNNFSNFNMIEAHSPIYTLRTHLMSNFVEALTAGENGTANIGEVLDWAKNIKEFYELFELLKKENNYNENDKVDLEFLMEKYHRYKVQELKFPENVDIFLKCHFRVFAEDELKMLYKLHDLQEQKSEQNILKEFIRINLKVEITELFPNFNIDHINRTLECKPVESLAELKSPQNAEILKTSFKDFSEDKLQMLYKLYEQQEQKSVNTVHEFVLKNLKSQIAKILPDFNMELFNRAIKRKSLALLCNRLKQLMRWLKKEFTKAVDKQITVFRNAADFIYYKEGQSYLNSLPKCCLDFKDPVDFRGFLDSSTKRVLWIVTSSGDGAFQMTRLQNILHQIQRSVNSSDDVIKYFSESNYTFMGWPQMQSLYPIYGWPIAKEYMMVVDNTSSSITLEDRTKLINHVHSKSMKLILITSQPVHTTNTFELIKTVNSILLTDLTLDSQNKIFERDNVIFRGDKGFSFRQFFGDDCSLEEINQILSSESLKNFVTIKNYAINLKDTRPNFGDLQVPFFKLNVKICKALLLSCIESPNANFLAVISGLSRKELETETDWKQLNRKEIIIAEGDVDIFFKDMCNKNQNKRIYLLEVSGGEFSCKLIFDTDFNLPRTFLHRAHIDVQKFAEIKHANDLFVIRNDQDKTSLFELIENCTERNTFAENIQIATTKEAEVDIIQKNASKNIHFVKNEKKNQLFFEWRYSHGSVKSLRYCVTMSSCDELTLSETEHNFVLIIDEPGTGKTTSLACLSRIIKSAWVIYIEMKDFQKNIERLPNALTDKNVAKFILNEYSADADDSFAHRTLVRLLQSETRSKRMVLMFNGLDELDDDKKNAKEKVVRLLIFLKNKPSVQIFLTARKYLKESLETKLNVFSTCFGELNSGDQLGFLVKIWQSCLSLQLGGSREEWKGRLRVYSEELLRQAKKVLRPDIDCFMGVPLHLRMLAEVFRPQINPMAEPPELLQEKIDIISVPKLYKRFMTLKYDIYIHDKTLIGMYDDKILKEDIFNNIAIIHGELGFQTLFSNFYENNIVKSQTVSEIERNKLFSVINRYGLVQSKRNGEFKFVHRTYAEYFCAQMVARWANQNSTFKYQLVKEILLPKILLHPDSKVIRLFLNFELGEMKMSDKMLQISAGLMKRLWFETNPIFRNEEHQTALHIAVKERNEHIVELLISGLHYESTQEVFVSLITQYDIYNDTALHIMDEPIFHGKTEDDDALCNKIIGIFFKCIVKCPYSAKEAIQLSYLFNRNISESHVLNYLLKSDNISGDTSTVFNTIDSRLKEIQLQIIPFNEGLLRINLKLAKTILYERLSNNIERYLVLLNGPKKHVTWLHFAALNGHLGLVRLLAAQTSVLFHIMLTRRDNNKKTPLLIAVEGGHSDIVKLLVERGANVNTRCKRGKTALMYAAFYRHTTILKYLIDSGAEINAIDNHGRTALYIAAGKLSGERYHIEGGADINSADYGLIPVLESLLQHGADPNRANSWGWTALTRVSFHKKWDAVQVLLEWVNTDVNADGGKTIAQAIREGEWSQVKRLIDKGALVYEFQIKYNLSEFKKNYPNYQFKI